MTKTIEVNNVIEHRGQWFTLLQLSEKHLKDCPEDAKLVGKKYKILNRVFMCESTTGAIHVVYFGAQVQFTTPEQISENKIAVAGWVHI